jgi:glyoxylase-like metal-dependent hydrolase (beta-lactamase superfamily II)/ferredoxin
MARAAERLSENAEGEFFVDRSCIDCETCRQLAPRVFRRNDGVGQSVVGAQPATARDRRRTLMALVACPTASIGSLAKRDPRAAARAFPQEIAEGVHYCGYAAASSYGASSYLIRRAAGNVLVDSPRAAPVLLDRIRALGGVRIMFLTHRDDVADHARLQRAFGCQRILHAADVGGATADVERRLTGVAPRALDDDLLAIPVPGHTRGSTALLYRDRFLFSGDHLWGDEDTGRLAMGRGVCWYSWAEQRRSLRRLLDHRFQWVLPGHGRRFQTRSPAEMRAAIEALLKETGEP